MPEESLFLPPLRRSLAPAPRSSAAALWRAVLSAREACAHERHLPQRGLEPDARMALLEALEAYVESLNDRGHPVPYALRDELRLQRLTCVVSRRYRRDDTSGER